jgi:pimeloyl-ACP methyl ester carboxylesterase
MEINPSQTHQLIDALPRSRPDLRYRISSRLAQPWLISLMLKMFSATRLSESARTRWNVAGIPQADLDTVLPTIRTMEDWWDNWYTRAAQCEAEAHSALLAGRRSEATEKFLQAYALYSISTQGLFEQPERLAAVTQKMSQTYAKAAPYLNPPAQRIEIPFEGVCLAGYLRIPTFSRASQARILSLSRTKHKAHAEVKHPLVMLNNGSGNAKEEMRVMEEHFLMRGVATLSVDGPGVGESWAHMGWMVEQERVAEAKLKFLETVPQVDLNRVGLFGVSLGGFAALRMASHLHRFRAVAVVCPPYDGPSYFNIVPHYVRETVRHMSRVGDDVINAALPELSLRGAIRNIRCPLLVVGAGKDSIVPADDARLIVEEARCQKQLLWYANDEHTAPQNAHDWQIKIAEWMTRQLLGRLVVYRDED